MDAVGKVTVQVEPDLLLMYQLLVPTVKSAVTVTGTVDSAAIDALTAPMSRMGCDCNPSICFCISAI